MGFHGGLRDKSRGRQDRRWQYRGKPCPDHETGAVLGSRRRQDRGKPCPYHETGGAAFRLWRFVICVGVFAL